MPPEPSIPNTYDVPKEAQAPGAVANRAGRRFRIYTVDAKGEAAAVLEPPPVERLEEDRWTASDAPSSHMESSEPAHEKENKDHDDDQSQQAAWAVTP